MKWFNKWFAKKCQQAWEEARHERDSMYINAKVASVDTNRLGEDAALTFKMHKATNGMIMEVRQYDKRTDRNNFNMYLITEDQDLGSEISKIITIESLKV